MNNKIIGKNIKRARELLGISQKELANKIGVSWEMISRYENGRSNPLSKISEISLVLSQSLIFFLEPHDAISERKPYEVPFYYEPPDLIKLTEKQFETRYVVAEWVVNKYRNVFVVKLKHITCDYFEFEKNDVGVFALDGETSFKYYLVKNKITKINKNILDITNIPGLVYVEKRYE